MPEFAILRQAGRHAPIAVQLGIQDDRLRLTGSSAFTESVRWNFLYRQPGPDAVHRFGQLGQPGWELSVSGGGDQALLSHIRTRPLARMMRPLHRLHMVKAIVGLLFLAGTIYEQLPAAWIADQLPASARSRLVEGFIDNQAPIRCDHPNGESAVRTILSRLDPQLGPKVDVVGIREGGIFALALPANKIFMAHETTSQLDADALAGVLAHELAHLRHDDPTAAMVRESGNLGIFSALLNGPERQQIYERFSGEEEKLADEDAIAMMKRAHIRIASVATFVEQMRIAKLQGAYLGNVQREVHFGMADRSRRYAAAAASDPAGLQPVLTGDAADDLFNYCWVGKVLPLKAEKPVKKPT